ncbi:Possible 4-carboxymuconolactone decarboxylase [Mycobacteroides abscessus]|nr:Possible 4-carboxymuconolactone decarboxylase [Mycobacteroides abscessus]
MDELRRQGLDKMKEVYGWDMPDIPGDYFKYTIDHLFGTIWTRPELSMRDRRLLLLGAVSALGLDEILEIQTSAALKNGELTEAELRLALGEEQSVDLPLATLAREQLAASLGVPHEEGASNG